MWQSKIERQMIAEARASREAAERAKVAVATAVTQTSTVEDTVLPLNEYYAYYSHRHEVHHGANVLSLADGTQKAATCLTRSHKWVADNYMWPDAVCIGVAFMVGFLQPSEHYLYKVPHGWRLP